MSVRRVLLRFCSAILWLCLFSTVSIVLAQSTPIPITIGENASGEIKPEVSNLEYAVTANGESVAIQVLALSGGLQPRFQVYDPSGIALLDIGNPSGSNIVSGSATFATAGVYTIAIQGENGTFGQFVLSVQFGAPPPPPVALPLNQLISGTVSSGTPAQSYSFSTTTAEPLVLTILSATPGAGTLISLFDVSAGRTIATSDDSLGGVTYHLQPADRAYRVEVRVGDAAGITAFSICLGCEGAPASNTAPVIPTTAPIIPTLPVVTAAACTITPGANPSVNVRSGPGTQYAAVSTLFAGGSLPVLGQLSGGSWLQVNANGIIGWVAASVAQLQGNCVGLPIVLPPSNASLAPTQVPTTASNPPTVAAPPSDPPTATPPPEPTLPDLEISITQLNRPGGDTSSIVALRFSVHNRGDASAPRALVQTCIDGVCSSNGYTGALAPGESATGSVTYDLPQKPLINGLAQFYDISVTVDADSQIAEFSESNNTYPSRIS